MLHNKAKTVDSTLSLINFRHERNFYRNEVKRCKSNLIYGIYIARIFMFTTYSTHLKKQNHNWGAVNRSYSMKTDQQTGELWGVGKMKQVRLKVFAERTNGFSRTNL